MLPFLIETCRWLGAGFLLTFAPAFGQIWFISLFVGEIKVAHGADGRRRSELEADGSLSRRVGAPGR